MTIYLLAPDPPNNQVTAIEAKLRGMIPELRKIESIEDIAAQISGKAGGKIIPELQKIGNLKKIAAEKSDKSNGKIIIIFVSPLLIAGGIDSLINISKRYRENVFFILVSNEISANDYKRLIRSGGADWVAAGSPLQEIPEIIYRQNSRPQSVGAEPQAKGRPTIVSFLPSMGGVGNTTIALEVALKIKLAKASRSWKICYVDFDFQTSHVCDFLDIEARLQIQEILDQPERLDEQLFDLFVSHHSSGLDIFAAPRSKLNPCEVNVDALDALLEMIIEKYDFVMFELPVPWFAWTIPTLGNSDAIVLTGVNTIPCLRQMRVTLDAVLGVKASNSQIAVVMNRVTHNFFGGIKRRGHVESVIAEKNIFYVREDPSSVERVNTGTPAALGGSSRYVTDIAKLASFCAALRQGALKQGSG